jgi:hypothetical protein
MVRINFAGSDFSKWLFELKDSGIELGKNYTVVIISGNHVEFTARPGNEDLELVAKLKWDTVSNDR